MFCSGQYGDDRDHAGQPPTPMHGIQQLIVEEGSVQMRILLVAPARVRVARDTAGPGGQVALLAEALTARGHDVTVATSEPSELAARVRRYPLPAPETDSEAGRLTRLYAVRVLADTAGYDVVHSFAGADVAALANSSAAPVLVTLCRTPTDEERSTWQRFAGPYVASSWAQALRASEHLPHARLAGAVYPALDVDALPYEPEKDGYLLALGPVGPGRGTDIALAAARRTEVPLVLTGPVAPGAAGFFEQEIAPYVDGMLVRYLPVVSAEERRRLLARARGLLLTPRAVRPWEPCAAEALAMGTPVVALNRGAARELVVHAETGFVASDSVGLVDGIDRLDIIDPRACRRRAERCWDASQVAAAYESIYAGMLAGAAHPLPVHPELEALDPREPVLV